LRTPPRRRLAGCQKAIGSRGLNSIKLTAPVFAGGSLLAESEAASRSTHGIVTECTRAKRLDGTPFISGERFVLVPKQGHGVDAAAGYKIMLCSAGS
jgi:acyl dehydratase